MFVKDDYNTFRLIQHPNNYFFVKNSIKFYFCLFFKFSLLCVKDYIYFFLKIIYFIFLFDKKKEEKREKLAEKELSSLDI